MKSSSIIDVALVNNEVDLARFRVEYLAGLVERHIFVEANTDHSGAERPYSLDDFWEGAIPDAVVVLRCDVPSRVLAHGSRWAVEEYSRQWAMVQAVSIFPDSVILISDIDEIPSRAQVTQVRNGLGPSGKATLPMVTSYRRANWLADAGRASWKKAKAFTAKGYDPALRFRQAPLVDAQPGQHFRYLGFSLERAILKHQSFAHHELDKPRDLQAEAWGLADSYLLANVPSIGFRGAGLLVVSDKDSLSGPAQFLIHSRPDLLGTPTANAPFRRRMVASLLVSRLFAPPKSGSIRRWRTTSLTPFVIAILAQVGAFMGLGALLRVMRRVFGGIRATRPSGRTSLDLIRGVNHFGDWGISSKELSTFQVVAGHLPPTIQSTTQHRDTPQFGEIARSNHIDAN